MEEAAFIVASRVSRGGGGHLLTACMDGVTFAEPTRVGDSAYVEAQATAVFGSSVEVMISLWGEVPEEGVPFHCGDAYVTVVSVDSMGAPVDILIEIVPSKDAEHRRYTGAVSRREARLELRQDLLKERNRRLSLDAVYSEDECVGSLDNDEADGQEGERGVLVRTLAAV